MADLKKGDVVTLKSGSQRMTIVSVFDDAYGKKTITCGWMNGVKSENDNNGEQNYLTINVPPDALDLHQ
jgi:uncharacterized protein YodC (DUF2158 family)